MKKKIMSSLLIIGILASPIIAKATESNRVYPDSASRGYSYGTVSNYGADGAAITESYNGGTGTFYAYVEVVNSQGWKIGNGAERYSSSRAYSGTITRAGGTNIYGSHSRDSSSVLDSRVF